MPWPLFLENGVMLMSRGNVIEGEARLESLLQKGLFRKPEAAQEQAPRVAKTVSPLRQLRTVIQVTESALKTLAAGKPGDAVGNVAKVSRVLATIASKTPEVILGPLVLDEAGRYTTVHPVMVCGIVRLLCSRMEVDSQQSHLLGCAALTANIGMLEIQDTLAEQETALTQEQKEQVLAHPRASVALLKQAGVTDATWLRAVLQHHERRDGSGYPDQLAGDDITLGARMIGLADVYAAMILPRRYRSGLQAHTAVREIFRERGANIDPLMVEAMIRDLGIFPPGTFVELANGDQGVVIRRGVKSLDRPVVSCLLNRSFQEYEAPVVRHCEERESFRIVRPIERPTALSDLDLGKIWGMGGNTGASTAGA